MIEWNEDLSVFIDIKTGKQLTSREVVKLIDSFIEDRSDFVADLVAEYEQGNLTIQALFDVLTERLRQLHYAQAIKAKEGKSTLTTEDIEVINAVLDEEINVGIGRDIDGNKIEFGLAKVVEDLENEGMSTRQLENRLNNYVDSSRKSFVAVDYNQKINSGEYSEVLNIQNNVETEHHPLCESISVLGWLSLEEMLSYGLPKRHPYCKCSLLFR